MRTAATATLAVAIALAVAVPAVATSTLTISQAQYYTKTALIRRFGNLFYDKGYNRNCGRRTRTRVLCGVAWFIGDYQFYGRVAIWFTHRQDGDFWHYSYDITRQDDYCIQVQKRPPKTCIKIYKVA